MRNIDGYLTVFYNLDFCFEDDKAVFILFFIKTYTEL